MPKKKILTPLSRNVGDLGDIKSTSARWDMRRMMRGWKSAIMAGYTDRPLTDINPYVVGERIDYGGLDEPIFVGGTGQAPRKVVDVFTGRFDARGMPIPESESPLSWAHKISLSQRWDVYSPSVPLTQSGEEAFSKWQSRQIEHRSSVLYGKIDPMSLSEEYSSSKLRFGRRGKSYWETIQPRDEEDFTTIKAKIEDLSDEDKDALNTEEMSPDMGPIEHGFKQEFSGDPAMKVVSAEEAGFGPPGKKSKLSRVLKVTPEDMALRMASAEYYHKDLGARVMQFSKWTTDTGLLGKPSPFGSAIYAHPGGQFNFYKGMLGQSKTLVNEAGEVVDWNKLKITGKSVPTFPYGKALLSRAEQVMEAKDPITFKKKMERLSRALLPPERSGEGWVPDILGISSYEGGSEYSDEVALLMDELAAAKYGKTARYAAKKKIKKLIARGEEISRTSKEFSLGVGKIRGKERWGMKSTGKLRNEWMATIAGYENIKNLLRSASGGEEFLTNAGKVTVADATKLSELMIMTKEGKVTSAQAMEDEALKETIDRLHFQGQRKRFKLAAVRKPGVYGGIENAHAVELYWGTGEFAGFMEDKAARDFEKSVEAGYLGDVWAQFTQLSNRDRTITAHLFEGREGKRRIGRVKDNWMHGDLDVQDALGNRIKETWKRAFSGEEALLNITESTRALFPKPVAGRWSRDYQPFPTEGAGKAKSRMWVAMSIAAGAMLMWGASRIRGNQAITEKDVPRSLYGSVDVSSGSGGPQYQPSARVVPSNTGYSTNIDMETTDRNGNIDYRPMANNMGSISSSSLGVSSTRTTLHVIDDSERMDRESTRNKMNQYLSL
jgi:hypothetical protein